MSDAFLQSTMTKREAILDQGIFEVFPDNPDRPSANGVAVLRESIERVKSQGKVDSMPVLRHDIRRSVAQGDGFDERYWSPVSSPVLNKRGEITYIILRVEDVTEFVRSKQHELELARPAEELRIEATRIEAEIYSRSQDIQEADRRVRDDVQAELEQRVEDSATDLQRETLEHERTGEALRRSEEELRQAQKMEAIGRLAGGVSHDFNNLLTVILGYTDSVLADPQLSDSAREDLGQVLLAGERAAALTRQLLAFSRHQVLEPQTFDVNETLTALQSMLSRVLAEDVTLDFVLAPKLDAIRMDRGQFEQVVMNLVVNARDAMPRGGTLTIETANVVLDEAFATTLLDAVPGPHVTVRVSDTGIGMDRATQARVFEPYFTTKPLGKGTGLGLATVFGIVRQSGGVLSLETKLDHGTTFTIYLPRATDGIQAGPSVSESMPPPNGSETILLVEDDEHVRAVARRILCKAGYLVFETSTSVDAVRLAREHPSPIHLLLIDVVMPTMNGRETAEQVVTARPGIKVLFMSGYTGEVVLHHGVLESSAAYLQKPLTVDSLTRKVRRVLDA